MTTAAFTALDDVMGALQTRGYKQLPDSVWREDSPQFPDGPWFSYDPLHNCVEFTCKNDKAPSLWQVNIFFCKEHDRPISVRYTTLWWEHDDDVQHIESPYFPGVKQAEHVAMVLAGWAFRGDSE